MTRTAGIGANRPRGPSARVSPTTEQGELFGSFTRDLRTEVQPIAPWARESETSYQAALAKDEESRTTERRRVYDYIKAQGEHGATRDELEQALGLEGNTCRPRVWELLGSGGRFPPWIRDSGRNRATRAGRSAAVLVVIYDKA